MDRCWHWSGGRMQVDCPLFFVKFQWISSRWEEKNHIFAIISVFFRGSWVRWLSHTKLSCDRLSRFVVEGFARLPMGLVNPTMSTSQHVGFLECFPKRSIRFLPQPVIGRNENDDILVIQQKFTFFFQFVSSLWFFSLFFFHIFA